MLEEVLRYCNRLNADDEFVKSVLPGTYTIEGGSITPLVLTENQYFAIWGSDFNDGVHQYGPDMALTDETFYGSIWLLRLPPALVYLSSEIEAWRKAYEGAALSIYDSEAWGGWSGSKKSTADGSPITWQSQFAAQLNTWRKI